MVKLTLRIQILIVFLVAVATRLSIFFGAPAPTGDVGEFATFVKEISLNNGYIPYSNQIYFPGSRFIYPPLIFASLAWINGLVGNFIALPARIAIDELFYLSVGFSSVQAAFLYWYLSRSQTSMQRLFSAGMVIFFDVSLYSLSWGGYSDIIAIFMLILILYFMEGRREGNRWILYSSVIFVLMAFTHDLTYFFTLLAVVAIILFDLLKRDTRTVLRSLIVLAAGSIAGIIWWLPRLSFVLSAFTISTAQGTGSVPIITSNTAIFQIIPYSIPIVLLAIVEFASTYRLKKFEPLDSFTIAFICTGSALVFAVRDPTLAARIILFSYTLAMIVLLKNLHLISKSGVFKGSRILEKRSVIAVVIAFVAIGAPLQIYFGNSSVNFFSTGQYAYDEGLVQYGATHFNNGTVIAPQVGTYLSAIDGTSSIIYTGFVAGPKEITERNAAITILSHSTSQAAFQNITKFNVNYIIIESSLINQSVAGGIVYFPQPYYSLAGIFGEYSVYKVNALSIPSI